jgi:ATP-dependent RNA helicase SUPV3L1/SUV3
MAKQKGFTHSMLKRRGWTKALMDELLPPSHAQTVHGRTRYVWSRSQVMEAEKNPVFQARLRQLASEAFQTSQAPKSTEDENLLQAQALLCQAWDSRTPAEEPQVDKLAGLYHKAIVERIPSVAWAVSLKPEQAMGRVTNFLAMTRNCRMDTLAPVLKNLVTAAPWLGRNPRSKVAQKLKEGYASALYAASQGVLADFAKNQPAVNVEGLLDMEEFPTHLLLTNSLGYIYSVFYVPLAIRQSLQFLAELHPKDEYPAARAMKRHFIVHIGGTNTGKTYAGFQRLIRADTGVYLAPLRLLALEAQELLLNEGVACSLTTGEEEDRRPHDTHVAATAEKLDMNRTYDVAVVDECQMIADTERGYAWTRAILGVQAPEVHLCAAPEAKNLLLRIIQCCGDTYEVVEHQRKTPLLFMNRPVTYASIQPGDALITFSKVGVLSIAEDLRSRGKEPAIIYGALPYSTRRKQVAGFLAGDMDYVVSTDAIGMGLNLPIRRIIFMETEKFDGHERRDLKPAEIQQIAGRAGRYGMYDKGYVGAMENLSLVRAGLETVVPPLQAAVVGFSDLVLTVDFDLLEVLEIWNRIPTPEPFVKLDISRYITIITRLRREGFSLTKEQELRAANIPFDETDGDLNTLFLHMLQLWQEDPQLVERPKLPEKEKAYTLPELELYCRKLDLYFSFSKAFACPVDLDDLYQERERIADEINQILLHNLKNNIRFCVRCNAALPLHHKGRICDECYRRMYRRTSRPRRG